MSPLRIALAFLLGCFDIAAVWLAALADDVHEAIAAWLRADAYQNAVDGMSADDVAFFRSLGVEVVA